MDISGYVKALKFYRVYLIVWLVMWESHVTSKRSHGRCVLRVFSLKVKARSVFLVEGSMEDVEVLSYAVIQVLGIFGDIWFGLQLGFGEYVCFKCGLVGF